MIPDLEEWYARELTRLRSAYEAGNQSALLDAMRYCGERYDEDKAEVPVWILQAMIEEYRDKIEKGTKEQKPSHRPPLNSIELHRRDVGDYVRFDCVEECREHGFTTFSSGKQESAFEKASELLMGTEAGGSRSSIRDSWLRVKKTIKSGKSERYYITRRNI